MTRTLRLADIFAGYRDEEGRHGFTAAAKDRGHEIVSLDIIPRFETTIVGDFLDDAVFDELLSHAPFDMVFAGSPCQGFSVGAFSKSHRCRAKCAKCGETIERASGEIWIHRPDSVVGCERADKCGTKPTAVKDSLTYEPKSETARLGWALARRTQEFIMLASPAFWLMENPVGLMRQIPLMSRLPRVTVDQCQYGNVAKKPTDFFGKLPPSFVPKRCAASRELFVDADGNPLTPRRDSRGKITAESFDTTPYRPNPDGSPCHEAGYRGSTFGTQGKSDAVARAVIPYELSLELIVALERDIESTQRLAG